MSAPLGRSGLVAGDKLSKVAADRLRPDIQRVGDPLHRQWFHHRTTPSAPKTAQESLNDWSAPSSGVTMETPDLARGTPVPAT